MNLKMNLKTVLTAGLASVTLGLVVLGVRAQNTGTVRNTPQRINGVVVIPGNTYGGTPYVATPYGVQPYYSNAYPDPYFYGDNSYAYQNGNGGAGNNDIPRANDFVEAKRETNRGLYIRWNGEPRLVSRILFSLLDRNRRVIQQRISLEQPGEAHLKYMKTANYYQIQIEYVNGTKTVMTAPY